MSIDDEFLRIYNLYKEDVLRLAVSYLNNINDAEDIYQTVFTKLYKELIKNKEINKEWLLTVTANECKNFFKSSWVKRTLFLEDKEPILKDSQVNFDIEETLSSLPNKYRVVIYLYYYEGYNIKEIGKILHKCNRSINYMLKKGREKLKEELKN